MAAMPWLADGDSHRRAGVATAGPRHTGGSCPSSDLVFIFVKVLLVVIHIFPCYLDFSVLPKWLNGSLLYTILFKFGMISNSGSYTSH